MSISASINNAVTLRDAISQVFNTMVFMSVEGELSLDENLSEESCVVACISFMGNYEGSLSIRCSQACAKAITVNLLAMEEDEEVELSDVADAMGEIANMSMGTIKSMAYEQVGELTCSAPTVYSGMQIEQKLRAGEIMLGTTVAVDGTFCLEVHLVLANGK